MSNILAQNIKLFRERSGISLAELAKRCNASKGHIWDLETGASRNPTLSTLQGMSLALRVPIHVLIGESESESSESDMAVVLMREICQLQSDDLTLVLNTIRHLRANDRRTTSGDTQ